MKTETDYRERKLAKEWQWALGGEDGGFYMSIEEVVQAIREGKTLQDLKAFWWWQNSDPTEGGWQ